MPLPPSSAVAPNPRAGGSGDVASGAADDEDVPPTLQTPTVLSTAHAQLAVLEGAIRAAVASTGASHVSTPSHLKASETARSMNTPATSRNATPLGAAPVELGAPTGIMAATQVSSVTATTPPGASERLSALHDNLRRVRHLMQQYEEASQRVIEVHLIPSPEMGEPMFAPVTTPTAHADEDGRVISQQHSSSCTDVASSGDSSAPLCGNGKQGVEQQKASPSLHQHRALASDAVFTRFCGLRVTPAELLLPLQSPANLNIPAAPPALRGIDDHDVDRENWSEDNVESRDAESVKRCGSDNNSRSGQTAGSVNANVKHDSAAGSPRDILSFGMAQRRQRTNVETVLEAYAKLFYNPSPSTPAAGAGAVRELQDTQHQLAAMQRCRLFGHEAQLRAAAANNQGNGNDISTTTSRVETGGVATIGVQVAEIRWQHIPIAVQNMQDSLAALQDRFTRGSHYACCGSQPMALVRQLHTWTQPLLWQLNNLLSNPTLEEVDESTRERLRRMKFDAEEMQQAQAQAIANGDMQRSEELYYEQASLAEAMAGPYDEMEASMLRYRERCVDAPLTGFLEQRDLLTTQLTHMIEENTSKLSEVALDVERVKEKRRTVAQARHRQRNSMSTYHHSWKKAWQTNTDQQMACYRAVAQLEKQLSDLQEAQCFLVDDWISRVAQERQREEDAAAFACFANARSAALAETQRNLQAVVEGVRQYSGAVQFSCHHVEAFVCEVLQGHLSESQLALRKDRLEQFRALYLTLGDLHFKKARNAEEIQKKIEYYTLQQEIAMDVLNPKAKEFSQAKQRWEAAKAEALLELGQLDQRIRLQLKGFRPTEQLLRQAGVDFVSPEEDLSRRTQQRSQKLLEYRQLIEEGIGARPTTTASSAASFTPPMLTTLGAIAPSAVTGSCPRTRSSKGLLGTETTLPPRPWAAGSPHPHPRPPTTAGGLHPSSTTPGALGEKNGCQLPPLRSMSRTYPPLQCRGDDDKPLAASSPHGAKPIFTATAVAAAAATPAFLSSLHSTEERIVQGISKQRLVARLRTGTNRSPLSTSRKANKR
ncbi:paraflagellar_rod_protein (plasmid) [Leishmania braziliensis MHOM/BR/75/M2904]|nr:paraflagellar_rod_protein [Leishmania braziliensis MHOM/BR/75/M2904]